MKIFFTFVIKESKHILRDTRTMMVLFGMPIVMMLLFGFAISTEVKNVRTVVVTSQMDSETQQLVQKIGSSEYFTIAATVSTPAEAEALMRNQKADIAVVFTHDWSSHKYDGEASIQILSDCTDPNTALMRENYLKQIISAGTTAPINSSIRLLYNPQMRSAYNFVPGIMGLLLLIICAMMTSVSIVKEKERSTMEVLLVSPTKPIVIILAKAVPYLVLSMVITVIILLISKFVLLVPLAGNVALIFLLTTLYIFLALALGLLISVVANKQIIAILMSGMVLLLPSLLLSGMIFPIESMPKILQWFSVIIPNRWFISALRKLMIMGVSFEMVRKEFIIMVCMTIVLITVALKKFKSRLE